MPHWCLVCFLCPEYVMTQGDQIAFRVCVSARLPSSVLLTFPACRGRCFLVFPFVLCWWLLVDGGSLGSLSEWEWQLPAISVPLPHASLVQRDTFDCVLWGFFMLCSLSLRRFFMSCFSLMFREAEKNLLYLVFGWICLCKLFFICLFFERWLCCLLKPY